MRSSRSRIVVDLPAPFGPEEAEDLARLDGQVDVDDASRLAVPLGQVVVSMAGVVIAWPPLGRVGPVLLVTQVRPWRPDVALPIGRSGAGSSRSRNAYMSRTS